MAVTTSITLSVLQAEARANGYTSSSQLSPDVIGLANGGYAVAYTNQSSDQNFPLFSIRNAAFAETVAVGIPYGPGRIEMTGATEIARLANGNLVMVWDEGVGASGDVVGAIVNPTTGAVIYSEFQISGYESDTSPEVAALQNGNFVVAMTNNANVYLQIMSATGAKIGNPIVANAGYDVDPVITGLADGGFAIAFMNDIDDTIYVQTFDANGAARSAQPLLTGALGVNNQPAIAALPNGNFALVYNDTGYFEPGITLQIIDRFGKNITPNNSIRVDNPGAENESNPDVAVLANGQILVSWQNLYSDGDSDILGRLFSATGQPVTLGNGSNAPFSLSSSADTDSSPSVAHIRGGVFVTAWADSQTDGSGGRISSSVREVLRTAIGDSGADRFVGDELRDTFTGGAGNDTFVYRPGGNEDTIIGFIAGGTEDRIDLSAFADVNSLADVLSRTVQFGADAFINFGNGDLIKLQNVQRANLTAADFTFDIFQAPTLALGSFGSDVVAGGWSSNLSYPRKVVDVNGDGRADIVGFGGAGAFVAVSNGNGTFQSPMLAVNSFGMDVAAGGWSDNDRYLRELGDVNGDGRADIVGFGGAGVYVGLGNANGSFQAPTSLAVNSFGSDVSAGGWSSNNVYVRQVADVNGDGRDDIVGFGGAGVFVGLANANGTFQAPTGLALDSFGTDAAAGGWSNNDAFPREVADVNGDGRADIIGFGGAGVFVALANANGTFANPILGINSFGTDAAAGGWISNGAYLRQIADVNADGRADIVGFGSDRVYLAFGRIDGTFGPVLVDIDSFGPSAGGWSSQNGYPRELADINGDGDFDIAGFGGAGVYLSTNGFLLI